MSLERLGQAVVDAAAQALGTGAQLVAARAKTHAPVRSVFGGTPQGEGSDYVRPLNIGEVMANRTAQVRAGLPPQSNASVETQHAPVWWRDRRMGNLQSMHMLGRDPLRLLKRRERIDQLTTADLKATFAKYTPLDRYTVVTLQPEPAAAGSGK
jgi:hypothetical protein